MLTFMRVNSGGLYSRRVPFISWVFCISVLISRALFHYLEFTLRRSFIMSVERTMRIAVIITRNSPSRVDAHLFNARRFVASRVLVNRFQITGL